MFSGCSRGPVHVLGAPRAGSDLPLSLVMNPIKRVQNILKDLDNWLERVDWSWWVLSLFRAILDFLILCFLQIHLFLQKAGVPLPSHPTNLIQWNFLVDGLYFPIPQNPH